MLSLLLRAGLFTFTRGKLKFISSKSKSTHIHQVLEVFVKFWWQVCLLSLLFRAGLSHSLQVNSN